MRPLSGYADRAAAEIAGEQHGNVTRAQLLDAGLSHDAVKRRVRKGLLHPEFPGVYRLGHKAPSTEARYMAAVLACGPGARLCGHAASYLYSLTKGPPPRPEVTTATNRRVKGVITHRAGLDRRDVTLHKGIPVTTVPRTLVDIAGDFDDDELSAVCHEAQVRYRVKAAKVFDALGRRPNARGARQLRAIFTGDAPIILSRLERAFRRLLQSAGLPLPLTNRSADGRYIDCRWPEHRLTVELDSYTYHHTRHAWQRDHRRQREAYARGDQFRSYTWDDVTQTPQAVIAELRPLIT